jgi:hypothetical protein
MTYEHKLRFLGRPGRSREFQQTNHDIEEARRTNLFTSNRSRFCSCSGLERRRVAINVSDWVRT